MGLLEIKCLRVSAEAYAALLRIDVRSSTFPVEEAAWRGRDRPSSRQAGRVSLSEAIDVASPTPTDAALLSRIQQIVQHQNQLREQSGMRRILEPESISSMPLFLGFGARAIAPLSIEGSNDHPCSQREIAELVAVGDYVFRMTWGDTGALNYAYRFDGDRLTETTQFAVWIVERMPDPIFGLVRGMDSDEASLWRSG